MQKKEEETERKLNHVSGVPWVDFFYSPFVNIQRGNGLYVRV